ncbi:MAG: DNA polymerase I [Alphaproteobacteria bacterium]|nr:DNA polymerase I [Alphaproteobacteria bacterium]
MEKDLLTPPPNRLYIVDVSGFIFRAFHAIPLMTRPDGTPINAVFGFVNMLLKLLTEVKAHHLIAIFDAGRKSFRNEMYPAYKAHRPETPPELVPQFSLVRAACKAFNIPTLELNGFEADDLIATYTEKALAQGMDVTIVSSDKDLMQLVSDHVVMLDTLKNKTFGIQEVYEKFGVLPEKVVDVLALIGDKVDNVPGVPGIGIKTAAELIQQYGDLESLLQHSHEIKQPSRREKLIQYADEARLSYRLINLKKDIPVSLSIDDLAKQEPDVNILKTFLKEQSFISILRRLENQGLGQEAHSPMSTPTLQPSLVLNYQLVQTEEALENWIERAYKAGHIAVDTETTSLDPIQATLVGISLSIVPGEACYIPLAHKPQDIETDLLSLHQQNKSDKPLIKQIPFDRALALLKPLFEDRSVIKIGQNLKYDLDVLAKYNLSIFPIDDTMVISYVLDSILHGHGMDELAQLHLGHTTVKYKEVVGTGRTQKTFDYVDLDIACNYAAEDADITNRLYQILKPRLITDKLLTVYETLDRPLIPILAHMEQTGITVDIAELKNLSRHFAGRLSNLETEIYSLAGKQFNIASPKQLADILFGDMGLEAKKKGKSGTYSTDADVLDDMAAQGHPLPLKLLEWRQIAKLKNTYADALAEQINPVTGRVHTSYGLTSTSTGRLSSSNPNLQNIPIRSEEGRKIRKAFTAAPGFKLISLDYSQIELRLLAHMAEIDILKQAFHEGIDIHTATAAEVFGLPVDKIDSELRSRAKTINFGIIYGISAFGLARQLKTSQSQAAEYMETYFLRYPGIQAYMETMKATARKQGYIETLFGRRCFVPGILDKLPQRRNFAERQAINAPLQGTAADIIKLAMIRVGPALQEAKLQAKMLLQVHDELIFEVLDKEVESTISIVRKVMERAAHLSVPLTVDAGVGENWDETG